MQNGYRLQWYGIFPLFLIQYLAQLGLLILGSFLKVKVQNGGQGTEWRIVFGLLKFQIFIWGA